jgi:DNA-binding XRE family transcriptional regulator
MTQDQLAAKIGVTRTSITNIEAGTQKLSIYLLYSIAISLELEISSILPLVSEVEQEPSETVHIEGFTGKMSPSAAEFVREAVKELSNNDES